MWKEAPVISFGAVCHKMCLKGLKKTTKSRVMKPGLRVEVRTFGLPKTKQGGEHFRVTFNLNTIAIPVKTKKKLLFIAGNVDLKQKYNKKRVLPRIFRRTTWNISCFPWGVPEPQNQYCDFELHRKKDRKSGRRPTLSSLTEDPGRSRSRGCTEHRSALTGDRTWQRWTSCLSFFPISMH